MGIVYAMTTGLLSVIGALYGAEEPVVGWIAHMFHNLVFALIFATGLPDSPPKVCRLPPFPRRCSGLDGVSSAGFSQPGPSCPSGCICSASSHRYRT